MSSYYADIKSIKDWYDKACLDNFTNLLVVRHTSNMGYDFPIYTVGEKSTRDIYEHFGKLKDFVVLDVFSTSKSYDEQIFGIQCLNFI